MKFVRWFGVTFGALALVAFATVPGPTTFDEKSGYAPNGGSYRVVYRIPGRPLLDLRAHAQQVQHPRFAYATIVYEVQQLGAATTATAASIGATATDTLTWAIPFSDNNYVVSCSLVGTATAVPGPAQFTHTSAAVTLTHAALTAAAASNAAPGTECTGIHF